MNYRGLEIVLVVPCYNEENAIGKVISDFNALFPELKIYVFDNNSNDQTKAVALGSGAIVYSVHLQGKGNVVRRMFADVDADIYVMVDGDATYDAASAKALIDKMIDGRLDMVVGCRVTDKELSHEAYRRGHQWGNRLLTQSVMTIFGGSFTDMLSGYRAFSKRYAKSFPAISSGFEIETELTIHALELKMPYGEILTKYSARPEGSFSKLSTYKDGFKIAKMILRLFISERPFSFFGWLSLGLAFLSLALGAPIFLEYLREGIVPRLPTAVLCSSMMVASFLFFICGLILDNVTRARHEVKRLTYLQIPPPLSNIG